MTTPQEVHQGALYNSLEEQQFRSWGVNEQEVGVDLGLPAQRRDGAGTKRDKTNDKSKRKRSVYTEIQFNTNIREEIRQGGPGAPFRPLSPKKPNPDEAIRQHPNPTRPPAVQPGKRPARNWARPQRDPAPGRAPPAARHLVGCCGGGVRGPGSAVDVSRPRSELWATRLMASASQGCPGGRR